jgi:hypothetical protein
MNYSSKREVSQLKYKIYTYMTAVKLSTTHVTLKKTTDMTQVAVCSSLTFPSRLLNERLELLVFEECCM